jgi:hypothetical protein
MIICDTGGSTQSYNHELRNSKFGYIHLYRTHYTGVTGMHKYELRVSRGSAAGGGRH